MATSVGPHWDENSTLVVNELLSYCSYYRNNSSKESIKKVILDFYLPQEITTAKECLWRYYGNRLGEKPNRRTSSVRLIHEADLNDVLDALQDLDSFYSDDAESFVFLAHDLSRLPKYGPEEVNLAYVVSKLTQVENKLNEYTGICLKNQKDVQELNNKVDEQVSYSTVNTCTKLRTVENCHDDTQRSNEGRDMPPSLDKRDMPPRLYSETLASAKGNDNNNADFQVPRKQYNIERRKKEKEEATKKKRKTIYGKAGQSDTLKGAPNHAEIFVFRLDKDTDPGDVQEHVESSNVQVVDINKTSHEDAKFCSFKLTINFSDLSNVLSENFWPENVACRRFFKPRPTKGSLAQK